LGLAGRPGCKAACAFAAHLADHLDQRQLPFVRAVRKVQADHIDARADQIPEDRLGVGGRPQRGNDLCAALGGRIGETDAASGMGNTP